MTGDLIARIINQAEKYGEIMLTIEEFGAYWKWTQANPHTSIAVGPGRVIVLINVPVKVLTL